MEGLSLEFLTGALQIQLPPVIVARAGWKFEIAELVDAHKLLGLKLEVRFRFTAGGKKANEGVSRSGAYTAGSHIVRADFDKEPAVYFHAITVSQELDLEEANDAIWHEMRHAWQAEAWANKTGKAPNSFYADAYRKAQGGHGESYENNAFEVDARNYATNRRNEGKWLITAKK